MNPIALIILTAMMIDAAIRLSADLFNLMQIRTQLPQAFKGWYDPEQYKQSQRYLRTNTRFGWITSAFDLLIILSFWFSGGFAWLDEWVRSLDYAPLISGMIYIGLLLTVKSVLSLPFNIYATFVIEDRFGFNKTTWATYIKDRLKGLTLALILGGLLLAALLWFFQHTGNNAWWYCWIGTIAFMLLLQYIAPTWIMPLFNRFKPLPPGDLRDAIETYASSIDFTIDNIFVMDGSKRSTKSNAFFTGFGRYRRIVLFDTLIEKHSVDELVAILAHEMGHYKQKHILKMLLTSILQTGLMFFVLSFFISQKILFEAFYVQQVSIYAGLIFFSMLYAPIDMLLSMAVQILSRYHEYSADHFAVTTSAKGKALVTALKKISVHNLSNLRPHPFYVFLNYSHPPVLQRIETIERIETGDQCN